MKRGMVGGAHRGPVGVRRQRRTVRFVQILLVVIAAALLMFAGYSWGRSGAAPADDLTPSRTPGPGQTVVLVILGLGSFAAAFALQGSGEVRLPTPHRLRELEAKIAEEMSPVEPIDDPVEHHSAKSSEQSS